MKYRRGTKVEVLNKTGVSSGSWRGAEIISGNGHTYSVKYDSSPPGMNGDVERVSRKVIRPRPPLAQGPICWAPGDLVEIFDTTSWKLAEVLSAADRDSFFVRLLGSSMTIRVQKSHLRLRQLWHDGRWVVMGKRVRTPEDDLQKEVLHQGLICQKTKACMKVQNCKESTIVGNTEKCKRVPSGGKKRGLQYNSSIPESINKKLKTGGKEGTRHQLAVVSPSHLQQKGPSWRLVKLASKGLT